MLTQDEVQRAKKYKLSENFTLYEFIRSGGHPTMVFYPVSDIIEKIESFASNTVQKIRDEFGTIHIHSGYRNPLLNSKVGGVYNSVHQYVFKGKHLGEACDLSPDFNKHSLEEVFTWIIDNHEELGLKTAIIYRKPEIVSAKGKFIHIDTRVTRPSFKAMEKIGKGHYEFYNG